MKHQKLENTKRKNFKSHNSKLFTAKVKTQQGFRWNNFHELALLSVIILSSLTRFYSIHEPAHVCWDETHFGKMASWYINRTFFFDVHPPLGKMMIALSGHLTGYDGKFPFEKPGDKYEHWTQYVGMRVFCATLGFAIPIAIYKATLSMTKSLFSAILASLLVVFDNGMVTLTRYILLDPPLLFFISSSILGMAEFSFKQSSPSYKNFSSRWWFWLSWTGISIACAFSVKFVGLFIVSLVGLRTIQDLWQILADISKPITYFIKHLMARVLCLVILPLLLYTSFFWIHLEQLNHSGSGDGFYSSAFQSRLIGNSLHNSSFPAHLAYGAEVSIKNNRVGGAYLHSHWHLYPEGVGAKQQQVTTYTHKDSNNKWLVKRAFTNQRPDDIFVRSDDFIILEHVITKRNLHSHFEPAPITSRHYQVTCYGENGLGDTNDIWQIVKETSTIPNLNEDDRISTVKTRFRLVHRVSNCALQSHSKQLPKWAYEQLEVTCNPKLYDRNNFWNIEDNYFPLLDNVSFEEFAPSFPNRFLESHAVMLQGNAGLKPKEGEVTSRPWQWPLNYRGQFFSASKEHKIYLLGNPIVWWANILAMPVTMILLICLATIQEMTRGTTPNQTSSRQSKSEGIMSTYLESSTWTFLGWALHYLPFFFMGRILYFHHYFPAFMFSCMLTAMTTDYIVTWAALKSKSARVERRKLEIGLVITSVVIYTFTMFIPLTYGTKKDLSSVIQNSTKESWRDELHLSSLKWLDSWEF